MYSFAQNLLTLLVFFALCFTGVKPEKAHSPAMPFGWANMLEGIPATGQSFFVRPTARPGACANFVLTYSSVGGSVPQDVQDAVSYAADLWGGLLSSSEPIRVNVAWFPLPSPTLGVGIPNGVKNFQGAPFQDRWYPSALANARVSTDLQPGEDDMTIYLSNSANWYTGLDGKPNNRQQDLVSVALHELGHGLGFASVMGVDPMTGLGSFGLIDSSFFPPTSFPFPKLDSLPGAYDGFLVQGRSGAYLIDEPNPSSSLAFLLTDGDLALDAPTAVAAFGGMRPPIFAPSAFAPGTSVTHLDNATFANDTVNSLMSPFSASGTAIHDPGPIVMGLFKDMGWPLCTGTSISDEFIWNARPEVRYASDGSTFLFYQTQKPLELTLSVFESSGRLVKREYITPSQQAVRLLLSGQLGEGMYVFHLETKGFLSSGKFMVR